MFPSGIQPIRYLLYQWSQSVTVQCFESSWGQESREPYGASLHLLKSLRSREKPWGNGVSFLRQRSYAHSDYGPYSESDSFYKKKVFFFTCTATNGNILVHMSITIFWLRHRCAEPVVGSAWRQRLGTLFWFLSSRKLACRPFRWQHFLSFLCSTAEDKKVRKCRGMRLATHTAPVLVHRRHQECGKFRTPVGIRKLYCDDGTYMSS